MTNDNYLTIKSSNEFVAIAIGRMGAATKSCWAGAGAGAREARRPRRLVKPALKLHGSVSINRNEALTARPVACRPVCQYVRLYITVPTRDKFYRSESPPNDAMQIPDPSFFTPTFLFCANATLSVTNVIATKISQQSSARLRTAFGDETPCKTTIYNWFAEFKRGRINLNDEFRDRRLSMAVNNKNIDAVRPVIETDRHMTYHEIRTFLVCCRPARHKSRTKHNTSRRRPIAADLARITLQNTSAPLDLKTKSSQRLPAGPNSAQYASERDTE
ncbi:hypothetical protein EVAR_4088_1 [Eumeta japonica]|uniref:Mos1 transposase HTH domain-containing protein n=1 Tax=Eumeta variegata TaxID=151549 RepID=A0A4C1T3Y6_EUMVA|nr:hypothetical protein EVAR_4088_1 [Eumeta japonica]